MSMVNCPTQLGIEDVIADVGLRLRSCIMARNLERLPWSQLYCAAFFPLTLPSGKSGGWIIPTWVSEYRDCTLC
jgi:hypothetical protein